MSKKDEARRKPICFKCFGDMGKNPSEHVCGGAVTSAVEGSSDASPSTGEIGSDVFAKSRSAAGASSSMKVSISERDAVPRFDEPLSARDRIRKAHLANGRRRRKR